MHPIYPDVDEVPELTPHAVDEVPILRYTLDTIDFVQMLFYIRIFRLLPRVHSSFHTLCMDFGP